LRRLFDVLSSALLLLLASPILLVAALAIVLEDHGPVLYRQRRVGKDEKEFELLKLRTMVVGAERMGAGFAVDEGDPRITRVGRVLRRLSLDELPQLWNVLRGDMSLIGPRPTLAYQVERYTPRQRRRLEVRPGITGWAQVHGRAKLPWDERIELDVWYVDHHSFWLDVQILARTPLALLSGTYKGETGGWRKAPGRRLMTPLGAISSVEELKRRVADIRWYHSIDLGSGIVTPGVNQTPRQLRSLRLPDDLSGRSVLDVGAWDGFFAFEAERRGAKSVLAVDSFSWSGPGWGTKAGFELARDVLQSKVEDKEIDVLDLSPATVGTFDLVLFLGVLYHMRHPMLALERVASVTERQLIVETHVDLISVRRPAVAFYPETELYDDPSNWFAPNPGALVSMLREVGFDRIEVVKGVYPLPLRILRSLKWKFRWHGSFLRGTNQGRMVVHAFKNA